MPFIVALPKLSPTMEEGTITKWHKKEGDLVEPGQLLVEIATDKATMEYHALDEGVLRKILVVEGALAKVNDPIAIFTASKTESLEGFVIPSKPEKKPEPTQKEEPTASMSEAPSKPVPSMMAQPRFVPEPPLEGYQFKQVRPDAPVTPLAKRLAGEKGIDLSTVKGSGPRGQIRAKDIDLGQPDILVAFGRQEIPSLPPGSYEEVPLTPMRKIVGKRLQESKSFIPHFYIHQTINADLLFDIREQLKNAGLKVTYNDFVTRACALVLREHPVINSGYDSISEKIIRFKTVDISLAVTVEGGLITPIIRHADYKNLGEISAETKLLAQKAKTSHLEPHEYKGGSFTISNLGMFGVTDFVAVINPPQAAILAVGGIEEVPLIKDGQIQKGRQMKLTLSVDHRVIDGAEAAKFIKQVQHLLEQPALLLI